MKVCNDTVGGLTQVVSERRPKNCTLHDANKQVLIGPGLINHGLLEALCAEFAEGIMQEMLQMPTTNAWGENPLTISMQMKIEIDVNLLPKLPAWSSDSRRVQPSGV